MAEKLITIEMWRGLLKDVRGLPPGWVYEYLDLDTLEGVEYEKDYGRATGENTVLIIIEGGMVDAVINLPPSYSYEEVMPEEEKEGTIQEKESSLHYAKFHSYKSSSRFKVNDKVKYEPVFWDKFTLDLEPGSIGTVIDGGMGWGVHPDPAREYIYVEWENGKREGVLPNSLMKVS